MTYIDQCVQSEQKEFDGWNHWAGAKTLPRSEAKNIFGDAKMRRNILKSRIAYRDKIRGVPALA